MTKEKVIELVDCNFNYKPLNKFTFKKASFDKFNKFNKENILKNITLKIDRKKIYGLIGKNGSGKSTLTKILLNILQPDDGYIEKNYTNPRLLDDPIFFHSELSALDNFEAISIFETDFSSNPGYKDKKLDYFCYIAQLSKKDLMKPISHLSKGSKSKVGFALTMTFLEGIDILGLDEFFLFGDESYRRFSSDFIKSEIEKLQTSIIVSHSMAIIEETCDEVIVIDDGRIITIDNPTDAIKVYSRLR